MRAKIRNEMILGALSGTPVAGLRDLYTQGLRTVLGLRNQVSVRSAMGAAPKRSHIVRVTLRYGASAEIVLWSAVSAGHIVRIVLRSSKRIVTQDALMGASLLADRVRGDTESAVRVAAAIERGRRQLHRYFEESTRWL